MFFKVDCHSNINALQFNFPSTSTFKKSGAKIPSKNVMKIT